MKRFFSLLFCLALCLSLAGPVSAAAAYPDVPVGHWAESDIQKAADYGLMQGTGAGFGLGQTISRAEFVTILSRMFAWTGHDMGQSFSDVPFDKWYYEAVELAAAAGVAGSGDTFRPEEPITRLEMAQMLISALGFDALAAQVTATPFSDVSGEGSGVVALAYDIGMTTGVAVGDKLLFLPNATATREEAAAMLVRVYERYAAKLDFLHGFYAFSSYSQIGLTADMDAVSVGWARLTVKSDGTPYINSTSSGGNEWVRPSGYTDALAQFKKNGVSLNLNLYCSDTDLFLTSEGRSAAVSAVVKASKDYDGITMDAEGSGFQDDTLREPYALFLTELRSALPAEKALYVCVTPDEWYKGYDYAALGEICDKVILMAHDYQWTSVPAYYVGTAKTETPVTPIAKIYTALKAITDPVTGVADRSKIVLQLSFANVGLSVDENGRLTGTELVRPALSTLYTRIRQTDTEMGWSDTYQNPYLYYTTEDGGRYRLWYEDERSVSAKVELAKLFGIHGVSLWRLGNIPTYEDEGLYLNVWNKLLEQR